MGEEPDAPAAPETRAVESPAETPPAREVESPAEAPPAREVAQTRDWTPPTKEFAVFTQSLDRARQGAVEPPADSAASPQPERVARPSAEPSGAPPPQRVAVETPRADETPAVTGADADGVGAEFETRPEGDAAAQAGAAEARGRVARVREGTRARVGRMRDEAIVVLEETPDDSGLRFVVAAAALFVVFVVLLLLSTIIFR